MVKFSKLFALSVFAAMTTAVIGQLGEDYCTYSPDTDCYVNNGKPECCLDDSTDCPEEQPPCDIVNSPSPTAAPVPLPGADYCTYSPDTGCYMNNGKPECCLKNDSDCPDQTPPCDVTPPTNNPTKKGETSPPTAETSDSYLLQASSVVSVCMSAAIATLFVAFL